MSLCEAFSCITFTNLFAKNSSRMLKFWLSVSAETQNKSKVWDRRAWEGSGEKPFSWLPTYSLWAMLEKPGRLGSLNVNVIFRESCKGVGVPVPAPTQGKGLQWGFRDLDSAPWGIGDLDVSPGFWLMPKALKTPVAEEENCAAWEWSTLLTHLSLFCALFFSLVLLTNILYILSIFLPLPVFLNAM